MIWTQNQSSKWPERDSDLGLSDCESDVLHSATLPPKKRMALFDFFDFFSFLGGMDEK